MCIIDIEVRNAIKPTSTRFYAHRNILKKAAPSLAGLITAEYLLSCVKIHDVSSDVFEVLLRYIYGCEQTDFGNDTHTLEIIDIANKYGVPNLKLQAEAYYVSSMKLDLQNFMEVLQFADAKNCALLREAVMIYVVENPSEIVEKVSMDQFPKGFVKDMLVAMARKDTKSKLYVH